MHPLKELLALVGGPPTRPSTRVATPPALSQGVPSYPKASYIPLTAFRQWLAPVKVSSEFYMYGIHAEACPR